MRAHNQGSSGSHPIVTFATSARTFSLAQRMSASGTCLDSIDRGRLLDGRARNSLGEGASVAGGFAVRVHQKGLARRVEQAFTFASVKPGHQPAQPSNLSIGRAFINPVEAPMEQPQLLRTFGRVNGPDLVHPDLLKMAHTYRDVVRLCWTMRKAKGLKAIDLGRDHGFNRRHVGEYVSVDNAPMRRNLPPNLIAEFEDICGNSAISQWVAARANFTLLEEMQMLRSAA